MTQNKQIYDAVLAEIAERIEHLESEMRKNAECSQSASYDINPAFDTGGIRSRSPKKRAQMHNRLDNLHRSYMEMHDECKALKAKRAAYIHHVKIVTQADIVLETGLIKARALTNEERKELVRLRKHSARYIAKTEGDIAERLRVREVLARETEGGHES